MHSGLGAILTGDLIGSTKAPPQNVEEAMAVLAEVADGIARWTTPGCDARFTRYRGDGWQMYVPEAGLGLRAALVLNAGLRAGHVGLATRAAIGVGRIDSLGTGSLADARGTAFEASGHALDAMDRSRHLTIAGSGVTTWHRIIVDLLDERATRWSRQQAEATALYLNPDNPTLSQIAPRIGISAQAVSYRLLGAGAPTIRDALHAWEGEWGREEPTTGRAHD